MSKLIVVSHRVATPDQRGVGGLAVSLSAALGEVGGVWAGWSGTLSDSQAVQKTEGSNISYVTTDLAYADHSGYYDGFANRALWPLLHSRADLMVSNAVDRAAFHRVNRQIAHMVASIASPDDLIWIHDYHLIPMATALRAMGIKNRIGFFLHVPLPSPDLLTTLPEHREFFGHLLAYDLVGFQTNSDAFHFCSYARQCLDIPQISSGLLLASDGRSVRTDAFPIGIDASSMTTLAIENADSAPVRSLRDSLRGRLLAIGVDRLDYSKGLPERFAAVGDYFAVRGPADPLLTYLQIAPVSRGSVPEYQLLRSRLEQMAGRLNGEYADADWSPIRYVNRNYARATLAGFYRAARIGLVTPLRDGMNLVAKEYVASQVPSDPGVLILSKFAGASHELSGALTINPHDRQGMVASLQRAASMSREERIERWLECMNPVLSNDVRHWAQQFISNLSGTRKDASGGLVRAA